ncbi:MAG: cation:proton antiporter [Vampirovibrionales bacterium]|jgi:CPA2 family monovalent cation:H+ antiporter-2|nr:cation:proton antiporter [Vampirovibrionales bacterium]
MFDASIASVLLVATVVATLFHNFKLPPVLGFMLVGALTGPYGLKWMQDQATVQGMAELGLIFLLFMVGLELSPAKLKRMKNTALHVGVRYMCLGTFVLGTALLTLKAPPLLAYVLGGVLSLSSTALVIKCVEDAQVATSTIGRMTLGSLIVQDIAVIPLLLLVPVLHKVYGGSEVNLLLLVWDLAKALLALLATVALSFYFIPKLVDKLAQARNRELFTLSVFCLGIGMAFFTHWLGLSLEAGAFVGGLALSGSLYSKQVLSDSRPFRDVFASVFFVSLGALLNWEILSSQWLTILALCVGLLGLKTLVGIVVARQAKLSWKVAISSALLLFQVGELSFMVLRHLKEGIQNAPWLLAWSNQWMDALIHAIILSLWVTPLLSRLLFSNGQARIAKWTDQWDHADLIEEQELGFKHSKRLKAFDESTVLIIGYGPVAQQLAEALRSEQITYHVLENNALTVKSLKEEGATAVYGDATSPNVLESAGIKAVDLLVVTVPIVKVATAILFHARELKPELTIVARAKYRTDVAPLYEAGADAVIYDELESGHRFIHYSLLKLGFSMQESHSRGLLLRHQFEGEFHPPEMSGSLPELSSRLPLVGDTLLEWMPVPEGSPLICQSLEGAKIRQRTGVNIVSIIQADTLERRDAVAKSILNPGDVLISLGKASQLDALREALKVV